MAAYIIYFLIWLISFILVRTIITKTRATPRLLPPSPRALPIIGHLHLLAPIPHQALHKLSNKYGPVMHLFLGSVPCVVASSSEMAKEFLQTHETSFLNRPQLAAVDYLAYDSFDFFMAPYGPFWKFMKKVCMSELLGRQKLVQFHPLRREEIRSWLLHSILRKAKACKAFDLGGELTKLTSNIISRMIMSQKGSENEDDADEVRKLVQEAAELTGGVFNLADFIWFCKSLDLQGLGKRLKDLHDRFDAMMERTIKEHEEARRKQDTDGDDKYCDDDTSTAVFKDLVDVLLDMADEENSEIKLTRENIKTFIQDLFVAGTGTSAITMEWAMAELINHPNAMEKARQEIDSVVGKSRLVEESDITNLPYIQAIVKETLRLHPTAPLILRESSETCIIGGYEIPAKTRLIVNVWAIGRDSKHWENPLEFQPERFYCQDGNSQSQVDVRGHHFNLLPFGSGKRLCPGTSLALHITQTTLAAMIQCFEWKVSDGRNMVDMEEGPGMTVPRAKPLLCVAQTRLDPFPAI